ncbi:orotate phosphoribosyltransferase [Thiohalorhabdus denitrificans]|uniref:orotate phosphoribosyltransferase n=1 Tax=Thiohalorhabdus denitrificans TaxID=381306 RepID=UPI001E4233BB
MDLMVGVPRSGMLAASLLATHRNLPLIDIDGFLRGAAPWFGDTKVLPPHLRFGSSWEARRALVLDDSILSGGSMARVTERLKASGLRERCLTAAVYYDPASRYDLDLGLVPLDPPRVFEWNLMHKDLLNHSCVDIDGVLCRDPTPEENDDGPRYRAFLEEVPAWHVPSQTIGYLVTSRLECYREITERWLRNNGIRFNHLYMMDVDSAEERRRRGNHASLKGRIYKRLDARLFIESSHQQAMEICRTSGKATLSYEKGEILCPGGIRAAVANGREGARQGGWTRHIPEPVKFLYRKCFPPFGMARHGP